MAVLKAVRSYHIIYDYIGQLPDRIKRFVHEKTPKPDELNFLELRNTYLQNVSQILRKHAKGYRASDGSVPEDIGALLTRLAEEFQLEITSSDSK